MADELNIPTHRWYQPRYNISLAKEDFSKQWIFDSGIQKIDAWISPTPVGPAPLAEFALWTWFLKYDAWDFDGVWLDEVRWAYNWFLNSGAIDVYGAWVDGALWSLDWFLSTGNINVYGVWANSEAWA